MNQAICESWVARDKKVLAKCQHLSYFPLVVESGKGALLYDADGNEFIDFLSSASSLNLGSSSPVITAAIEAQLKKCTQYTAAYTYNAPQIEYAERLTSIYPGGGSDIKVVFGNCGSDANDACVKFARAFTGRTKIITFLNGYHGNTYGASSLSTCTPRMRDKMGPFLPDIFSFPFYGEDVDDKKCEEECVKDIETAFATYLPPKEIAAVIIEPIQGDGGILPAHKLFIQKLYNLCKENGILFIAEEVQQAFWRTGDWFSINHYGVIPDGIILGKSVGAGLTLGAFMARSEIMDSLPAPAHLFTLGGNALASSAGIAAFDYYKTDEFQNIYKANCEALKKCTDKLKSEHSDVVGFVRGIGLSCGIGICKKSECGEEALPDLDGTYKILYRAYEYGLIVISLAGNVLRIQPPLNIDTDLLVKGFDIIGKAVSDYKAGLIPDDVFKFRAGW